MRVKTSLIWALLVSVAVVCGSTACEGGGDALSAVVKNQSTEPLESISPDIATFQEDAWIPEIIVDDWGKSVPTVDNSIRYDYSLESLSFQTAHGQFSSESGEYVTTGTDNLLYTSSVAFPYGTISCSVRTKTATDSGIVFGLSSTAQTFWEGNGIGYYFFFLSREGTAYLGKTQNANWYVMKQVPYAFTDTQVYDLKVIYQGSKICCYVNGEFMIGLRDDVPLRGTGFGIRSGAGQVVFSNLRITNDFEY